MGLTSPIKDKDWVSVRQAIAKSGSKLGPKSSPTFAELTLTDLTASRLVATDADKTLVSSDMALWVIGTANEISVTDDSDGSITLSIPSEVTLVNPTITGTLDASGGEVLIEDNATSAPTDKSDGYVGVAKIGADGRLYFVVEGVHYYIDGTAAVVPITGNPIGLLLALTYNLA